MRKKNQLQKWVRLIGDFNNHLTVFITVNAVLWVIWLIRDAGNFYSLPLYVSVVWSVILLIHYFVAYEKIKHDK